jgi:hypothetical protein
VCFSTHDSCLSRRLRPPFYPIYDIRNARSYEDLFYFKKSAPQGGFSGLSLPFSLPLRHPPYICSAADPLYMGYYIYYDPWLPSHLVYFNDLCEDFWRVNWDFEVTELGKLSWWGCCIYEGAVLIPWHQDIFWRFLKTTSACFYPLNLQRVWWSSNLTTNMSACR